MFHSTRLKLTISYVLIIMFLTISFSAVVYYNVNNFAQRAIELHERRVESRLNEFPRPPRLPMRFQEPFAQEAVSQVRHNTIILLLLVNISALLASSVFGYWFTGRALKPVEVMVNKQKKFVADAAHELKTPLAAMKTQFEVNLRNKNFNLEQAKKILASSVEEVDSLTLLVNSLLKKSNYSDKNAIVQKETFAIKPLAEKIISEKFKDRIQGKKINLETEIEDVKIRAHKSAVTELLTILIDNAIKFNSVNGSLILNIAKKDNKLKIKVKDSGQGISKKDLPYIFDRFYKADSSRTKDPHDGFGLGLSIAKEIVELHQGNMEVSSRVGKETVFTATLSV